jgi:hypothetical protein
MKQCNHQDTHIRDMFICSSTRVRFTVIFNNRVIRLQLIKLINIHCYRGAFYWCTLRDISTIFLSIII